MVATLVGHGEGETPLLKCWCDHCQQYHHHQPAWACVAASCTKGGTPYGMGGYVLVPADEADRLERLGASVVRPPDPA